MIDELLFPGMAQESRFTNGMMMLECGKAILESVYKHFRVVQEGYLRIIFTPELKVEVFNVFWGNEPLIIYLCVLKKHLYYYRCCF